jgi:hypothetical protein
VDAEPAPGTLDGMASAATLRNAGIRAYTLANGSPLHRPWLARSSCCVE